MNNVFESKCTNLILYIHKKSRFFFRKMQKYPFLYSLRALNYDISNCFCNFVAMFACTVMTLLQCELNDTLIIKLKT